MTIAGWRLSVWRRSLHEQAGVCDGELAFIVHLCKMSGRPCHGALKVLV